jgi:dipeptide transport system substrate-binding protein
MNYWAGLLLALPLIAGADTTLRFCAAGSPKTFDPAMTDSGIDHMAHLPVFGTLVEVKRGTDQLTPGLAASWTISPDGLAYTFELRRGVAWHTTEAFKPTRAFNADDVLFTFGRTLSRDSAFATAFPNVSPYTVSLGWEKQIRKIEKLGEHQIRITLAERDASFLPALTFAFAGIQSAELGAQLLKAGAPQRIAQMPVGTGPFQLKSFRKDAVIRYVKHPGWWRKDERPRADQLVYAITPDANVRAQRLRRDECDIAAPVGPAELTQLKKDATIRFATAPGLNVGILAYNTKKPALAKLEVRQALDMAIDKAAILRTVYGDAGTLATTIIPAANWAHDATLKAAPHDPAKARALLQKAGVLPLNLQLWAMPVTRAYNPNGQLMAQMIQADWAKVGVTASGASTCAASMPAITTPRSAAGTATSSRPTRRASCPAVRPAARSGATLPMTSCCPRRARPPARTSASSSTARCRSWRWSNCPGRPSATASSPCRSARPSRASCWTWTAASISTACCRSDASAAPNNFTEKRHDHQERQVDPAHGRAARHDRAVRARPSA